MISGSMNNCRVGPRLSRARLIAIFIAGALSSLTSLTQAQGVAPPLWTRDSIRSTALGETRFFRIALPEGYDNRDFAAERYPVLIVLDAEFDEGFAPTVANTRALAVLGPPQIPRVIVVGVENTNRLRDMTPVEFRQAFKTDVYGGAPAFLRFLSTELWPYISQHYRALPVVVLAGHSLSGLFAAWAFGQQPDLFRAAIALSPSFVGNSAVNQQTVDGVAKRTEPGRLYVAAGTAEGPEMRLGAESFVAALYPRLAPGVIVKHEAIGGASHDHTSLFGLIAGLQFVFDPVSLAGYEVPSLVAAGAPIPRLIAAFDSTRERYIRGARQLGMPQRLPLSFLRFQSTRYQDSTVAPFRLRVCQEYASAYPTFWYGHACTGDAQTILHRIPEATASYRRASEAARRAGENAVADSLKLKGRL